MIAVRTSKEFSTLLLMQLKISVELMISMNTVPNWSIIVCTSLKDVSANSESLRSCSRVTSVKQLVVQYTDPYGSNLPRPTDLRNILVAHVGEFPGTIPNIVRAAELIVPKRSRSHVAPSKSRSSCDLCTSLVRYFLASPH
jgi:hypothetical protein